jgi:hypothetical protein
MPVTTRATIRTATCHSSRRCNVSSGVVAGTWMREPMPLCSPIHPARGPPSKHGATVDVSAEWRGIN